MTETFNSLTSPIMQRGAQDPERLALVFIEDSGAEQRISAGQFHRRAAGYAQALQEAGIQPEELVVLVLKHSETLLYAFWGAMYLGAIGSIFPFLTEKLDPAIYFERVRQLVIGEEAKAVITYPENVATLSALLAGSGCRVLSSADVHESAHERAWPEHGGEKIAFLQHSSGTTGLQKGVALSHQAVRNQVTAYGQALALRPEDVIVSWLPLYHDMGLIAGFVLPLVAGVPLVLMSPFKWVGSPKLLLQAIQRHRGTLCWLPNFAYNHMARVIRPADLAALRLDTLRALINCSEPVFYDSQRLFLEKFAACGVQPEMLQVCYAMAENTFAVTQTALGQPAPVDWVNTHALQAQRLAQPAAPESPGARALVSCGGPIAGTELRVLDADGQPLPERQVGEIALRSNCMLSGYYHRPNASAEALREGWYLSGDMGYLAGGELYITGRKKDMIIVGGKNIYPQDIEAIAATVDGLAPGRCVAFGVLDAALGSEKIVLVAELADPALDEDAQHAIEMELRRRVVQRSEVTLADVRLVGRKWLIKTSSGKLARSANREKYLALAALD